MTIIEKNRFSFQVINKKLSDYMQGKGSLKFRHVKLRKTPDPSHSEKSFKYEQNHTNDAESSQKITRRYQTSAKERVLEVSAMSNCEKTQDPSNGKSHTNTNKAYEWYRKFTTMFMTPFGNCPHGQPTLTENQSIVHEDNSQTVVSAATSGLLPPPTAETRPNSNGFEFRMNGFRQSVLTLSH